MRYAVVTPGGIVENVIEWNGRDSYKIQSRQLIPTNVAGPGWTYDVATDTFNKPPPVPPVEYYTEDELKMLILTAPSLATLKIVLSQLSAGLGPVRKP